MWSAWSFGRDDSSHDTCMLCFGNLVGFTTLRFSFLRRALFLCSFLARHSRIHWNFNFILAFLRFLYILHLPDLWNKCLSIMEFWLLDCPLLLFSPLSVFPILVYTSGHTFSGLTVVWMFVSLSPNHICPFGGFSFNDVNFVNPVYESVLINFDSRPHSTNHLYVFHAIHPDLCEWPWSHQGIPVDYGMFLSTHRVELEDHCDDDRWSHLDWTKKCFRASPSSIDSVGWGPSSSPWSSPLRSSLQWVFGIRGLLTIWLCHLQLGIWNVLTFVALILRPEFWT